MPNILLGWKHVVVANTLAYNIADVCSFGLRCVHNFGQITQMFISQPPLALEKKIGIILTIKKDVCLSNFKTIDLSSEELL